MRVEWSDLVKQGPMMPFRSKPDREEGTSAANKANASNPAAWAARIGSGPGLMLGSIVIATTANSSRDTMILSARVDILNLHSTCFRGAACGRRTKNRELLCAWMRMKTRRCEQGEVIPAPISLVYVTRKIELSYH